MDDWFRLRLPATSANLGPGFDAVGLAMRLFLEVEARVAGEFSVGASGRDAGLIGTVDGNLVVESYRGLAPSGPALELKVRNEIPLGMGCGSSAAALLAGVELANHFGGLGLTRQEVLEEACAREGHPDNVAACFHGGLTVSSVSGREVTAATLGRDLPWRLMLALPKAALATKKARGLLPESYSREDAVRNVQAVGLLVAAFALGRPELLQAGTADRLHQPYRAGVCPLLTALLPLAGRGGVYSVSLSGAGPAVLLIVDAEGRTNEVKGRIEAAAGGLLAELVVTAIHSGAGNAMAR